MFLCLNFWLVKYQSPILTTASEAALHISHLAFNQVNVRLVKRCESEFKMLYLACTNSQHIQSGVMQPRIQYYKPKSIDTK